MQVVCLVVFRDIIRLVICKIRIHPYSHFSSRADEYHLLADVEVSYFLIKHLKPLKCWYGQIKLIAERNVVDFFQSKIHLLNVEQTFVDGRAKIFRCGVEKILNFIDEWWVSKIIVEIICSLLFEGRGLFSQFNLFCIGLIILLGSELKLILFHVLISEGIVKSPYAVGINRAKHPSLRFLD